MCALINHPSSPIFSVGETIVAIYKELPYAAKIEKIKEEQGVRKYIVHYIGWNHRQDVKVEVGKEDGILFKGTIKDYVEENRATINNESFLEEYDKKMEEEETKKEKKEVKPVEKKKDCQWIVVNGVREEFHWTLEYPDILEQLLKYDEGKVRKGFVAKLPARVTADDILVEFGKSPESSVFSRAAATDLLRKFNTSFHKLLLTPTERAEYKEFKITTTANPSAHYGFIHLVRLLRKLPEFIRSTVYDLNQFNEMKSKWQEFVDYLAKHYEEFYTGKNDYQKNK
ncbi:hypothetical protein CAEBREN_16507 [Caenorhabditis brenneri]|uniref:MRG domain-containing protein n=1 Tax=Caenorhabditis brenneri TaxID=135651 RepID=G0NNP4_CAEBE|nr:hypothetical protein CAEBREN_16507 [Caenorhabditis brenneri]